MSAPTVRWSYSFEANGVLAKSIRRYDSEANALLAMHHAAVHGRSKFRLVKWTRKAKPKVVAKTSITFLSNGRCMCCDQAQDEGTRLVADLRRRLHEAKGKSVRLTLEVIES